MTGIKKIFIILLLLHVTTGLFAQVPDEIARMRPGLLKSFGKNAASQGDHSSAAMYYEAYMAKKPSDYTIAYKLAESYRLSKDFRNAESAYQTAYNLKKDKNALALFHYATMLKINGSYQKADEYYAKFKKEYRGKDKSDYLKLIKNNADAAAYAESMIKNPVKISIEHLGTSINTGHVEASPIFLNDSLIIYSSLKTDQKYFNFNPEDSSGNEPFRKFYTAKLSNDQWEDQGEYAGPFNMEGMHVSNGAFSEDRQRFYFTRCKRNSKNKVICSIYESRFEDGVWLEPVSVSDAINDSRFTSTQPTIGLESSKNREVLYFVSDREGGRGGMDIWYSMYDFKKKEWKTPLNAGSKLNTAGDEMTPYFDFGSKTMYFSSDGWKGMGGLDIFRTNGEMKKWTTPQNMGVPLNSSYDDLYYVLSTANKETGMFVSNRETQGSLMKNEACCDDIFSFQWLDLVKLHLAGTLFEEDTSGLITEKIPLKGAKVFLELKNPGDSSFVPVSGNFSDQKGNFTLDLIPNREYKLITKKEGFLSTVYEFNTFDRKKSEAIPVEVNVKPAPDDPIGLRNIYYEYGKATLTEAAKKSIDTTLLVIMQNNPDLVIELSSHTDFIGSDESNMLLSQQRAESVVNYLVSKGINSNLLKAQGYGETRPIAKNQNDDGSDNPEGRQLNRRTEFRVIGRLMPDGRIREPGNF